MNRIFMNKNRIVLAAVLAIGTAQAGELDVTGATGQAAAPTKKAYRSIVTRVLTKDLEKLKKGTPLKDIPHETYESDTDKVEGSKGALAVIQKLDETKKIKQPTKFFQTELDATSTKGQKAHGFYYYYNPGLFCNYGYRPYAYSSPVYYGGYHYIPSYAFNFGGAYYDYTPYYSYGHNNGYTYFYYGRSYYY